MIAFPKPPAWTEHARCAEVDPELFYPEHGNQHSRAVKAICQTCPVQAECLEFAVANSERFGLWGGLTERERRSVPRRTA